MSASETPMFASGHMNLWGNDALNRSCIAATSRPRSQVILQLLE